MLFGLPCRAAPGRDVRGSVDASRGRLECSKKKVSKASNFVYAMLPRGLEFV